MAVLTDSVSVSSAPRGMCRATASTAAAPTCSGNAMTTMSASANLAINRGLGRQASTTIDDVPGRGAPNCRSTSVTSPSERNSSAKSCPTAP